MTTFRQLERPIYGPGQILDEADLRCEQDYLLDRLRLHHRFLHGWGIAHGLAVSLAPGALLRVSPGIALDCAGNMLVLAEAQELPLAGHGGRCYLTLAYEEAPVAPVPAPGETPRASRVREAVRLGLSSANPGAGHRGMGPRSPGCGQAHALCLATLSEHGGRWRLNVARCRLGPRR